MTEAELTSQIIYRTEILWNLTQWWVSISFAVMIAAYVGAKHLTRPMAFLIITLYVFYSATMYQATGSHIGNLDALFAALVSLGETTELSLVGQHAIQNSTVGDRINLLTPFVFVAFLVTNGFVLFVNLHIRNREK